MVKKKSHHGRDSDPQTTRHPQFIKMILQSAIEDKKMIIPPKFAMKIGDTLSDSAELALYGGCTWQVRLKKENRSIYFDKNWHEFVEQHSIRHGYMLLFSYKGNSTFNVLIFDHSYLGIHKHRETSPSLVVTIKEEVDVNPEHDLTVQANLVNNREDNAMVVLDRNDGFEEIITSEDVCRKRSKAFVQTNAAIEAANKFKPQKPSFMVVLKPYNLYKCMYIGTGFAGAHLRGISDYIWIVDPKERRWLVKFSRRSTNALMLSVGIHAFMRDNDLQVGDVCVFELIEGKKDALKVTMFRQSLCLPAPEEKPSPSKKMER